MISLLIALILLIIIAGVGYWAIGQLAGAFGLPAPITVVCQVLIVLIAVLIAVNYYSRGGGVLVGI